MGCTCVSISTLTSSSRGMSEHSVPECEGRLQLLNPSPPRVWESHLCMKSLRGPAAPETDQESSADLPVSREKKASDFFSACEAFIASIGSRGSSPRIDAKFLPDSFQICSIRLLFFATSSTANWSSIIIIISITYHFPSPPSTLLTTPTNFIFHGRNLDPSAWSALSRTLDGIKIQRER